ncbi:MAG: DUF4252 domain-containing protein [Bacteroidales bacterium]|nr:DUF4252 domain-containing protein [Bacteroidales bacterium]
MKKLLSIALLLTLFTATYAQKSIDALFSRYSGKDGFVTLTLSGNLLKLACQLDNDNEKNALPAEITEIRILAQEDEGLDVENFLDLVSRETSLKDYEEFMSVKESHQDIKMLVRTEGDRFKEFLLIGGGDDNFVIQIKGDMTYKEARKLSSDIKKDHGTNLSDTIID